MEGEPITAGAAEDASSGHAQQGDRMRKLTQALDKATEKTLGSCTLKAFLACYSPELVAQHEDVLTTAHERFTTVFHTNVKVSIPFPYQHFF